MQEDNDQLTRRTFLRFTGAVTARQTFRKWSQSFRPTIEGRQIKANVEARQPVMVYRNEAAKKRGRS